MNSALMAPTLIRPAWSGSNPFAISRSFFDGSVDAGEWPVFPSSGVLRCCCADVRNVDPGVLKTVAVKDLAAAAGHQATWFLRRQPLASLPQGLLSLGPIPLFPPGLKIRFRPV